MKFVGFIGFMLIPYVDKNPSTRPSDRKFALMLYSVFLAGSATPTIIGVLFRGTGFNWAYPWKDGVYKRTPLSEVRRVQSTKRLGSSVLATMSPATSRNSRLLPRA